MGDEQPMSAANGETIVAGQRWAYRKGARDPVTCVDVLRVGTARPPRVRVRFVDDEYEGLEDWVPPGRLKVPWDQVGPWQAREARWAAVRAESDPEDTVETAASWVFDILPNWDFAYLGYSRDTGILKVTDLDGLVADLEVDRSLLVDDPVAFTDDDGKLIVPWRVAYDVAQRLARKHADVLITELVKEERQRDDECRWGYMTGSGYISAEICAETDEEYRPARELVREWCGVQAQERHDELVALRDEVKRLGQLIERAITALDEAGNQRAAKRLEQDLGVPIDVLREKNARDQRESGPYGFRRPR